MARNADHANGVLHRGKPGQMFGAIPRGLRRLAAATRDTVAAAVKGIQIARMQSVLNAMSDEQLRQIGVTRDGIRRHAEFLIGYEYDGL